MRTGPNQKRSRNGRGHMRRSHGGGGGGFHRNQSLDSNGPDVKLRGTANQIYDKYLILARDAQSSGDRVGAENYLQHAEHYFRMMMAAGTVPVPRNNGHMDDDEEPAAEGQTANGEAPPPAEQPQG
ncbi:MAG: DUF4167 domain-containing protein [Alphaproteobacteria bacterium]|nr:DUF4167 domain-containing protein [Alphaproteobacteria bacterium]